MLLYVWHQDFLELTEDETIVWSTLYNNYNEKINANLIDLLKSPKDNEKSETNNKEKLFEEDNDKQDEYWLNWILLLEMDQDHILIVHLI